MPRLEAHSATTGAKREIDNDRAGAAARGRTVQGGGMNFTAAPANRRRRKSNTLNNTLPLDESGLGETVLLLENRFFRPGGIRVGTMDQMMFRPGLAPDHHSPPPAFRRTTRQTVIPYSKGRPYRKVIGVSKLTQTSSKKREETLIKLMQVLDGDAAVEREQEYESQKKKSSLLRSLQGQRSPKILEGGRLTKLVNGKESQGRRPRSRHNWHRLAIEKSAGTIWGHSACSVRPEDLTSSNHL